MLPVTTIMGIQPKNGVDNAAPTMMAANTVTTGPSVSSDFGFFLFKRLLLLNSVGWLAVGAGASSARHRLLVAYDFADVVRDVPNPGQQGKMQDTSHSLFLSVCV